MYSKRDMKQTLLIY